jgi:hypothetical protein
MPIHHRDGGGTRYLPMRVTPALLGGFRALLERNIFIYIRWNLCSVRVRLRLFWPTRGAGDFRKRQRHALSKLYLRLIVEL